MDPEKVSSVLWIRRKHQACHHFLYSVWDPLSRSICRAACRALSAHETSCNHQGLKNPWGLFDFPPPHPLHRATDLQLFPTSKTPRLHLQANTLTICWPLSRTNCSQKRFATIQQWDSLVWPLLHILNHSNIFEKKHFSQTWVWAIPKVLDANHTSYCWWFRNPAITCWYGKYPIYLQGLSAIPGGCLGFLPSTVWHERTSKDM